MAKLDWLSRELLRSPVYYTLATNPKDYRKEISRLGIEWPDAFVKKGYGATTHFLDHEKSGTVAIVTLEFNPERTLIEHYALLQHEAVHIFQEICSDMGERSPSKEFEAYVIQRISLNLMMGFNDQLKKQPKKLRDKIIGSVCKS